MTEHTKIKRRFILSVIWILFFTLTLCGIITAEERTTFNSTGKEPETVIYNIYKFSY